ncbi:hypothetical protein TNCV_1601051 [Trichonephila clavipes]|nr:hypothetical protein TNCV_1601051 [Trichonephila clavipes]
MLGSIWLVHRINGPTLTETSSDDSIVFLAATLAMKLHLACNQSGSRMEHYTDAPLADVHLTWMNWTAVESDRIVRTPSIEEIVLDLLHNNPCTNMLAGYCKSRRDFPYDRPADLAY